MLYKVTILKNFVSFRERESLVMEALSSKSSALRTMALPPLVFVEVES